MAKTSRGETELGQRSRSKRRLGWPKAAATGFAFLFAIYGLWAWTRNFSVPNVTDYLSFWAAGHLVVEGDPSGAFDIVKHRQVEFTVTSLQGLLPFPYPPPFLLFVTPFSLLPYHWGFAAWVLVTGAIYVIAARRVGPMPYVFSHPAVMTNNMIGQTGFLVSGIFIGGTTMLRQRPFLAGIILGTLIFKPHFAVLLPVVVIAARLWPAIAGALLSSAGLLLLALLLLGADSYRAFFEITSTYANMMQESKWPWSRLASPFAFARYFGADQGIALLLHALVAAAAASLTWVAWSRDWKEQVPILASASMLMTPYVHTYDSLLLVVSIIYFVTAQRRPLLAGLVWLSCMIPVANLLKLYYGPNLIPIAAIISLAALAAPHIGQQRKSGPPNMDHAHAV